MEHKRIEIEVDNDEKVKVLYALLSNIDYALEADAPKEVTTPASHEKLKTAKKSETKS